LRIEDYIQDEGEAMSKMRAIIAGRCFWGVIIVVL